MSYEHLQSIIRFFSPILPLETLVSHSARRRFEKVFGILALVFCVLSVNSPLRTYLVGETFASGFFPALALLSFSLFLVLFMLERMFYSYYGDGAMMGVEDGPGQKRAVLQPPHFELAQLLYNAKEVDVVKVFVASTIGESVLKRLGVDAAAVKDYMRAERDGISFEAMREAPEQIGTIDDFVRYALAHDGAFANMLATAGIAEKELVETAAWVIHKEEARIARERWWSKDRLSQIAGIGKNWAYGETYMLERYARDITMLPRQVGRTALRSLFSKEAVLLETILLRSREANALVVSSEGVGALELVALLGEKIAQGTISPTLEHKRLMLVNAEALVAGADEKNAFERAFLALMDESVAAGNIILVFDHFPALLKSAQAQGSDVAALLDPYLSSENLQVIAFSEPRAFHESIERNGTLVRRFEVLLVEEPGRDAALSVLEDEALVLEQKERGLFFTHPALSAVAEYADRFIPYGVMPDKALDLLSEVVSRSRERGATVIRREDVHTLVTEKTGIPAGALSGSEREKLMNLDNLLRERVVGQQEALTAISGAMKRSRSGLHAEDKPIGAFLFLGPTGVGKTETAKALADIFFGSENALLRLDMSEYNGDDALERLIGSFENGKSGILAPLLKEHPYGVLLLDEFEKTDKKVLDLFLQIFDEGFFSDASGSRVSARNLIMIATSNAASDRIWELAKDGGDLSGHRNEIIQQIISRAIFKPELLNRFDEIILFHPLTRGELYAIARLMLQKLAKRLNQKGIRLVINEPLIKSVMEEGYDPQFGARPMRRAIQTKVEQVIAEKMISGEIVPGGSFEVTDGSVP